ncbi:DUF5924 family protein [Chondromyces apiculatus]|uniref:DUF2914 domain-containing protein n=1 Tax=Chondromyces apiculatus DSM 436 TaxID=1192034 RepID=A0A017T7W8_9BACT|nr:DUF5924 family protein [Chondromyces apiculatus]EYF04905.1 Hypothetical protein CAP_3716 [Chondromyces apiculatus DSM 436]
MSEHKPRRRTQSSWDPPTVVYQPDGQVADPAAVRKALLRNAPEAKAKQEGPKPEGSEAAEAAGAADPKDAPREPGDRGPDEGAPLVSPAIHDDLTVRMPGKSGMQDDPTVHVPGKAARSRDFQDDPTRLAPIRTPPTSNIPPPRSDHDDDEERSPQGLQETVQWILKKHGSKLWWLHTAYALGLGAFVVSYAQKGFERARWLAVSVGVAWLVVVLFFRLFGSGARQDFSTAWRSARLRFLVMTYVLKNLYQGMLFFLLPFYWKSASFEVSNRWFVVLLGACALLATLDLVFDRVLMRWKFLASIFYGVTLFACLNLVIPALLPNTRTLYTLMSAAAIAVLGFTMLHLPLGALRSPGGVALLLTALVGGTGLAYATRRAIPPVPMYLSNAAVGPLTLPDGRLAMEVKALHESVIEKLLAVTDVVVPGGKGDRLHHVWRLNGVEIYRAPEETSVVQGPEATVRLQSSLSGRKLPPRLVGHWAVDVETEDGQLVGRVSFDVKE